VNWPRVKLIETDLQRKAVEAASAADMHGIYGATHMVLKGDEIVGWATLPLEPAGRNSLALTLHWFSKSRLSERECFELINVYENYVRSLGYKYVMPVVGPGPFIEAIPDMGFVKLDGATFIKPLT